MESREIFLKALADKNRLRMVYLLSQKKLCVCELAYVLNISQPTVSKHLKKLESAQLIGYEQDGLWTNYYLKPQSHAQMFLKCLDKIFVSDISLKTDLFKLQKIERKDICCIKKRRTDER